jgi:hypothetical protein
LSVLASTTTVGNALVVPAVGDDADPETAATGAPETAPTTGAAARNTQTTTTTAVAVLDRPVAVSGPSTVIARHPPFAFVSCCRYLKPTSRFLCSVRGHETDGQPPRQFLTR